MPPKGKRGGQAKDATQPRVRAESPVHEEQPEVVHVNVARAGEPNEMAMFEQFRRFQEFMQREPNLRGAPGVIPPQHDAPVNDAPERVAPPPPPPVQVQGPSYWEAMRNLKDMGMETFGGKSNPIDADNWRKRLERNLDNTRCPHEYRRDLAVQYLKDEALVWKYFPREAMDRMENEFLELRQGSTTVRDYDREFDRLSRFAGRFMNEDELIRRFLRGLRIELKNRCEMYDYHSKIELVEKAANLEIGLEKEMNQNKEAHAKATKGTISSKKTWDNQIDGPMQDQGLACGTCGKSHRGVCWITLGGCMKCGELGHKRENCPKGVDHCHKCGRLGHYAKDCRVKQYNRDEEQLPPSPKRLALGKRLD
ncbi:PREDICTED: uncharacterized protein LOC104748811 [Camelina sativa]|uniref:Uncharacterized protein LOC104748811 n=1 Tax=Camelina sativa TaxID=90675 RepID=A0ABM0WBM6_CAMSA|nr:PREDICTED: uncharacterized protein LOC104748811 [Camelina sativa]